MTIVDLFWDHTRRQPNETALRHHVDGEWVPVTWAEYGHAAAEVAAGLVDLGMEVGDRIGILSDQQRALARGRRRDPLRRGRLGAGLSDERLRSGCARARALPVSRPASSPTPTSWPRCSFAGTISPSSPRSSCSTPFRTGSTTASSSASTSSASVGGRGSSPIPTWCTIEWRRSPTTRSRRSSTRAARPEHRRAPCSRTATSEPRSTRSRPWSRSGPTIGSCRSCRSRTSPSAS